MDPVAAAYDHDPEREWTRLERSPYLALEFDVTWEALARWIPPGAHILDAGGGPGRYALALCRAGWHVTLLDLSAGLLDKARANFAAEAPEVCARLKAVEQGDLRDLSRFADGSFDAVVCLGGPLTHLPLEAERTRAAMELARVARPGGLVFLTGVGYLAVMRWMLNNNSEDLISPEFEPFLRDGNITGATSSPWHFFRAAELRALGEVCGLETVAMRGCQGLSSGLVSSSNQMAEARPDLWQVWHALLLRTASDPTLVDTSEHILWIGRKPG
jgi:SAM-dependent methyltransferase